MKNLADVETGCTIIFGIFAIIILGVTLSLGIFFTGRHDVQNEAVAKGHAVFVVDRERTVTFKWLATQTLKVEEEHGN